MTDFISSNEPLFIFILLLLSVAVIVILCFVFAKSQKLVKSLLVNRFKVIDMNEKNTDDNTPLFTIIISNNSLNAVSVASIGYEHAGDYFNYRSECKLQLENSNNDLVILPRGSVKLRLSKADLESAIFPTCRTKRFGKLRIYIIGLGGESHMVKAKVVGKKMALSYREYYAYHEPEVIATFINSCNDKKIKGVKLRLSEKIKFYFWNKRLEAVEKIINPAKTENVESNSKKAVAPVVSSEADIQAVLKADTYEQNKKQLELTEELENAMRKNKKDEDKVTEKAEETANNSDSDK